MNEPVAPNNPPADSTHDSEAESKADAVGQDDQAMPTAVLTPRRNRWSWLWLLPVAAMIVAGVLGWQAYVQRGTPVVITFKDGHGLKTGDAVKYRGITVGTVEAIQLSDEMSEVAVHVRLQPDASHLALAGSRWWIVRPQIGLHAVGGLETVIGAREVGVLPGDGAPTRTFVGRENPPVLERIESSGLELTLETPRAGSLRPNMPVTYRQMQIGTVTAVDLASDARAVNVGIYIRPAYRALITPETRFWRLSGLNFDVGLEGFSFRAESLQTLLSGGIALATPTDGGRMVEDGHRFELHEKPDEQWLQWQPSAPIGDVTGGDAQQLADLPAPQPVAVTLHWTQPRLKFFDNDESRNGLGLVVGDAMYLPRFLVETPTEAEPETVRLDIPALGDRSVDPGDAFESAGGGDVVGLPLTDPPAELPRWPAAAVRQADGVEDVLIVDDHGRTTTIAASRLKAEDDGVWRIDESVNDLPPRGAPVVARSDGRLIGLLLKDPARIVPLPFSSGEDSGN